MASGRPPSTGIVIPVVGVWRVAKNSTALATCRPVILVFNKFLFGIFTVSLKKTIRVGDALLVSLPDLKIKEHFASVKGSLVYVVGGSHKGELAVITGVKQDMFTLKSGSKEFQTLKHKVIVVGKKKEAIKLS